MRAELIILTKRFPYLAEDITIVDGSSYYFYYLCKGLRNEESKVVVLCQSGNQDEKAESHGHINVRRTNPRRYFFSTLCFILRRKTRHTIVLTDGPAYTFLFGLVSKVLRVKHVAVFHDCRIRYYLSRLFAGHVDLGDIAGILLTYGSAAVNPNAVITVSESSKEELIKAGFEQSKIFITYNGISLNNILLHEKQDLIVHIGLASWKNLSIVIEAMTYVISRVSTARLCVIGSGDIEFYLEEVRRLKLTNNVRFFGLIPENEKQDIMRKSKVLTLVSSLEGFGIPILEAWKNDVAPVLSRLPVFEEIGIDGNNCVMTDLDPRSVADCIILLLQNDKLRKNICSEGRKAILNRFTLESVLNRFTNALRSLEVA